MDERRTPNAQILVLLAAFGLLLAVLIGSGLRRESSIIAFSAFLNDSNDIYTLNVRNGFLRNLTRSDSNWECCPIWSPDGRQIAFQRGSGVFIMPATGGNARQVSERADTFVWSPTGKQIAYVSDKAGNREIYVTDVGGSNVQRLTNNIVDDGSPTWAQDGQQIAYISYENGNWDIFVVHLDQNISNPLTDNESDDLSPAWSPNGQQIAFVSSRDGNSEIGSTIQVVQRRYNRGYGLSHHRPH